MHTVRGIEPLEIRSNLVNQVLKGLKNKNARDNRTRQKPKRLAMTTNIMLLLKELVRTCEQTPEMKVMVWSIHELLCRNQHSFDPDFDLLWGDIKLEANRTTEGKSRLSVKLECPKENKNGKQTIVDVFESGNQLCPVKEFRKWEGMAGKDSRYPLFELL